LGPYCSFTHMIARSCSAPCLPLAPLRIEPACASASHHANSVFELGSRILVTGASLRLKKARGRASQARRESPCSTSPLWPFVCMSCGPPNTQHTNTTPRRLGADLEASHGWNARLRRRSTNVVVWSLGTSASSWQRQVLLTYGPTSCLANAESCTNLPSHARRALNMAARRANFFRPKAGSPDCYLGVAEVLYLG
jgi:hypothetical protein